MDLFLFNDESILAQIASTRYELGYYRLHFYTENGKPVNKVTLAVEEYFLYPSGGTLRDSGFNIILYNSSFDTYRGFKPPTRDDRTES